MQRLARAQGKRSLGDRHGFTLIEVMLGTSILMVVIVALMGAMFGQTFLNDSARNMTAAMSDVTRIMEQIREQNSSDWDPCKSTGIPTLVPVDANGRVVATSWNAWLEAQIPGKSVNPKLSAADRNKYELVAVTCQDGSGGAMSPPYCGPNQVGAAEWKRERANTSFDPVRVTVAVSWRQGQRSVGGSGTGSEFVYAPARVTSTCSGGGCVPRTCRDVQVAESLSVGSDLDGDGAIEAPAMITTLISCR